MTPPIRSISEDDRQAEDDLPPELLRIIGELAKAQARKDYAAAKAARDHA